MNCPNCGGTVPPSAPRCPKCGSFVEQPQAAPPPPPTTAGYGVQTQVAPPQVMYVQAPPAPQVSDKSKTSAAVLAFFLGGLGIHRFYLGYGGAGAAQLILSILGWSLAAVGVGFVLLAIVGIWVLVDFINILTGSLKDANGRPLA